MEEGANVAYLMGNNTQLAVVARYLFGNVCCALLFSVFCSKKERELYCYFLTFP